MLVLTPTQQCPSTEVCLVKIKHKLVWNVKLTNVRLDHMSCILAAASSRQPDRTMYVDWNRCSSASSILTACSNNNRHPIIAIVQSNMAKGCTVVSFHRSQQRMHSFTASIEQANNAQCTHQNEPDGLPQHCTFPWGHHNPNLMQVSSFTEPT